MSRADSRLCAYTHRKGLLLVGTYMWLGAMFNIILTEWSHEDTILFLQGGSPTYLERDVLSVLMTGMNLACGAQIVSVTFGLLYGALFENKQALVAWVWVHSFQMAVYVVYLLAGVLVYSLVGDTSKVLLLLYGFANILIGACAWKMAFDYIRVMGYGSGSGEPANQNSPFA
jgi:hypothetical protein